MSDSQTPPVAAEELVRQWRNPKRRLVCMGALWGTALAEFIDRMATALAEQATALAKINDIRNSIIGLQAFNWSEHAYPLVAALNKAGIEGLEYPEARANVGTLLERANKAEAEVAEQAKLHAYFVQLAEQQHREDEAHAQAAEATVAELRAEVERLTGLNTRAFKNYTEAEMRTSKIAAERDAARAALAPMRAVVDAARCIRHWHNTNYNPKTGETEGMVVSAQHVRELWSALAVLPPTPGDVT